VVTGLLVLEYLEYILEYSGRVKKVGKLSVARQGLDLLIIVDHGGWVERGGLLHDAINLEKLSTVIVRPASCMYLCTANSIEIVEGNSETKGGKGSRAFGTPVVLLRDPNK